MLDAYSEQAFLKTLEKYAEEGPKNVILDLSQIDFVDSSGIGALVKIAKKVQNGGGLLQTIANPRVTQTVKLVRLEQFLSLQPSVEAAFAKLKEG
ncbi:MAG: STAS domain-containing protein [Elainellaceae cyanobacterium]